MSIGAVIIAFALIGLAVIGYKKRRKQINREETRSPSNSPSDSPLNARYSLAQCTINTPILRTVSGTDSVRT